VKLVEAKIFNDKYYQMYNKTPLSIIIMSLLEENKSPFASWMSIFASSFDPSMH
jgi:hypothetical protein